ncbi:hypothetical protein [Acholeplasma laidlawii]|uniref:Integral membrane protein n=2 Tax=Acholeplasma laidlawii TaxID=2148 RepID=A9NHJ6_ACHLI|nr:hypothetical protein [Acholeplasma laidlawii]ABX81826.1 integral membrane protein [Acholeplasma laidlawii PG-8A]NWH10813.1 hypothetical protein [Acholeplasma laidlawii]NWH12198.1 hypothetical protein [Acholeplasma laidlawii]NWH13584.1 hypothetical protein [Acholeplasma laidlawii]NWH14249.1 hypothetical protein [Acholeplasma laidlawii]
MNQKQIYFITTVLSVVSLCLYLFAFTTFVITTTNFKGIEHFIYWLVIQVTITSVSLYQYKLAVYAKPTAFKMSLLYFLPIIIYSIFQALNLGSADIDMVYIIIYTILFSLISVLYLYGFIKYRR